MKITFVYPETENLGVEYLSICLKKAGHDVSLVFDPMLFGSYFLRIKHLQNAFDFSSKIVAKIKKLEPDLICFSVFSDYYGWASALADRIKKETGAKIIFGGIHPTSVPEIVIKQDSVDFVCAGEGEDALVELADALNNGKSPKNIRNIWSKNNGMVHANELRPLVQDLDSIPFPDKELFKNEYEGFCKEVYTVISGRGCVNACTYCHNSYLKDLYQGKGKYLRRRSPENVLEELILARKRWRIERVSFFDDLFIYDLQWLRRFLEIYHKEIGLPYFCHVHPSFVNPETVSLLEESGCSSVTMGIQTFNERIRREKLYRFEKNHEIEKAIRLFAKTRIFLFTNIILGLPGQDDSVIIDDLRCSARNKADMVATNWLRYYPKVKLIDIAEKSGELGMLQKQSIDINTQYLPYSIAGNTYNKKGAKLRNLFSFCQVIPKKSMDFIIKHKIYMVFPEVNLRFCITVFVFFHRKIFLRKKNPFTFIGLMGMIRFYAYYIKQFYSWDNERFPHGNWQGKRKKNG